MLPFRHSRSRPPVFLSALVLLAVAACGGGPRDRSAAPAHQGPRLVVLVAIDQLRADLLERYRPAFTGGLAHLLDNGRHFPGASHRHSMTTTAVGHTTLSTGVVPTRHGIVGNSWREWAANGELLSVYSVQDTLSPILGVPEAEGRSAANLRVGGLADWMLAADPETRVVSISKKDRAAIPLAGRTRDHVYWIDEDRGRFVTSTWYRDEYPGWVERFNDARMPGLMGDSIWERRVAGGFTGLARVDAFEFEGDGEHTVFPHRRAEEQGGPMPAAQYRWASRTPSTDRAVLELARTAMEELKLGRRRDGPDYLALGFSQTDYVGHDYGPLSQEQLDNLVHLDRVLADLFELLDREVGQDAWILGFSADHGVMDVPEWSAREGRDTRRTRREEVREMLQVASVAAEPSPDLTPEDRARVAAAVEELPWVADALTPAEILEAEPDSFAVLFAQAYSDTRLTGPLAPWGVGLRTRQGVLYRTARRGTTHGSAYWFDRSVPFILMGRGVTPGVSEGPVYSYDMAPTLAALASVAIPTGLDGRPLLKEYAPNP